MALSDEDKGEVTKIMNAAFGIPEGKTFSDVLTDHTNATLNAYDKRTKKERDADRDTLKGIKETLAALAEKQPDPDKKDPDKDPADPDVSRLDPAHRKMIEDMKAANVKLHNDVQAERKAREAQEAKALEEQKKLADRNLRDAIRQAATAKDGGGVEPDTVDFVIDNLHGGRLSRGEQSLVRLKEDGSGYEMQFGLNKITNEPEWKPLNAALKEWRETPTGKRFVAPVPGGGTPNLPNNQNGQQPSSAAGNPNDWNANTFAGKSAKDIRESTKDLRLG